MASSRTTAQRRRAKAMARQTTLPKAAARPLPEPEWDEPDEPSGTSPRWPSIVGLLLCVAGIGVATYLTVAHYDTQVTLACSDKGVINCQKVTTSSYSEIHGVPVALLGLLFFVFMLPLQLPVAWRSTSRWLRSVRLGSAVVGIGTILWLIYAELLRIKAICLYCTAVHVLTLLLFATVAFGTIATAPEPT